MNALFTKQIMHSDEQSAPDAEPVSTMFDIDRNRNAVGWTLIPKPRPQIVSELTLQDRRELATNNPPLANEALNARAKRIYASGGNTKQIKVECGVSKDYAAKLHAAFGRAAKKEKPAKPCNSKKYTW